VGVVPAHLRTRLVVVESVRKGHSGRDNGDVSRPLLARRTTVLALLATLTTACGSTVQLTSSTRTGPAGVGQTLMPPTDQTAEPGTVPGGQAAVGGGVTAPSAAGPAGPTSTATGTAAAPGIRPAAGPAKGFGFDATTVSIGVITQKDAQQAFAAFGAKNVDPGDSEQQALAVTDEINRTGGILGRKVKIVFKDVATLDTATNPVTTGSAVCTYFGEDHPVVAVISIVTLLDYPEFRACMAKKRIPLFSATVKTVDQVSSDALAPYYFQTIAASWTQVAPVLVDRLKAQGWFSPWDARLARPGTAKAKVGVLVDGSDTGTRLGKLLQRELARVGHPDAVVFQYEQASDGQNQSVQYFQGNGVTHVIVTDVELTAFQMSAASQQYKPRFGISTYNDPYTNLEADSLTPNDANNGAMGIGWAPGMDVSDASDPGASPGAARCTRLMRARGQTFTGNRRLALAYAQSFCDSLLLFTSGARAAGSLAGPAVYAGMLRAAPTHRTAVGFSTGLTSTKRFVSGTARDLAWIPSCSCFRYGRATTRL